VDKTIYHLVIYDLTIWRKAGAKVQQNFDMTKFFSTFFVK